MQNTPLSERISIVIAGRRNSGKSSLMNHFFEKEQSIVSDQPGTTTDPVTRAYELIGLGPVALCDTAGFDDLGALGNLRVGKTGERLAKADLLIFVSPGDQALNTQEEVFLNQYQNKTIIKALSFADRPLCKQKKEDPRFKDAVAVNNLTGKGIEELRQKILSLKDRLEYEAGPLEGLVREGDFLLLVTPIDLAAPKARLILPQVQTIRDALDHDCQVLICKERELAAAYANFKKAPALVITDSQAFSKVASDIPPEQALTSFSIIFARKKGELSYFVRSLEKLKAPGKKPQVLILEACSHHRQADDIGSVKIPRLFRQLAGAGAEFHFKRVLPPAAELEKIDLVIHCAACTLSRSAFLARLEELKASGKAVINYGLFLAWANGLLPRALEPFPLEYSLYQKIFS